MLLKCGSRGNRTLNLGKTLETVMCPVGSLCALPLYYRNATSMSYQEVILLAPQRVSVETRSIQLHCPWFEELTSSSPRSPSSVTSHPWEAEPCWDDFAHEISGLSLPIRLEGLGESPSKAFLESIRLLLSSLDIYKQGTTCVSVCLLASNGQNKCISPKSDLQDSSTYDHLEAHPKD